MSEEAVRQTRSQKRALEREAAPPQSADPSEAQHGSKKPKLDPCEPSPEAPTEPQPDVTLAQDGESRTQPGSGQEARKEEEKEEEGVEEGEGEERRRREPSESPSSLALPPASQETKEDPDQRRPAAEAGSAGRTICGDRDGRVRAEPAAAATAAVPDTGGRVRPAEPKTSSGLLAAGEVKATIKVEVQTREQPMDMSTSRGLKQEKRPPSPEDEEDDDDDDVIILSDNDSPSPPVNGLSHLKELDTDLLMKSSPAEREQIIKQLKEELRLEEAKLVLLKKLRQSQIQRDTLQKPSASSGYSAPPPLIRGTITSTKGSQQIVGGRSSGAVIPPPLVRGGQQVLSKHGSQIIMPPLVRGAQPISVSPQQIQALRQQQQQQLAASGASGSGPPPLLLGPRTSAPSAQGLRGIIQPGLIRVGSSANTLGSASSLKGSASGSASIMGVNDSPASRQAAAKLALRKQLEKTLLDIPPPKPPAPEFNFLPSAANNEFIYLVGLEEVVQNLLDTIHRGKTGLALSKPPVREPSVCTQCHTDFTCRWRLDRAKGGLVLCEDCMSSNQKKALKAEHTTRLKAAFVKALQQEQEIEQRIMQQTTSSSSSTSSSTSSSSSMVSAASSMKQEQLLSQQLKQAQARVSSLQHHHHHHHHHASRGAGAGQHHSIKQGSQGHLSHAISSVVRGVPHSFSSSSQLQSAVAAAALVSRPGVTMAYVNPSLTGHKTSAGVDARQREYLLDMIPSRSSISQTANTWK